ncbi:MAG TPA: helix-turn-helix domain-containing protein [Noviherbaspirillum sp.]
MNDEAISGLLARAERSEGRPAFAPGKLAEQDGRDSISDALTTRLIQVGDHATIVAYRAYKLHAVGIDQPALIVPLSGTKGVEFGAAQATIEPGAFLMIHQVTTLQVENLPPTQGGHPYRAWAIGFPWRLVELARSLLNHHQLHLSIAGHAGGALPFSIGPLVPLLPSLQQLLDVLAASEGSAAPDAALVDHALLGVMIALASNGHGQFLRASDPSLGARIRLLVAAAPERDWTSADFEDALNVSGATLRRRLAEENTSLRLLLREARLHHGLVLLQTSRKPLKSVAHACGYRSVPSFTRNFIDRFGIEPAAVAQS